MPFEMTIVDSGKTDFIEYDEELIFYLNDVYELKCNELEFLWDSFYYGPTLGPNQCRNLAIEIERIDRFISKFRGKPCPKEIIQRTRNPKYCDVFMNKEFFLFVARIRKFFSDAADQESYVRTFSG